MPVLAFRDSVFLTINEPGFKKQPVQNGSGGRFFTN